MGGSEGSKELNVEAPLFMIHKRLKQPHGSPDDDWVHAGKFEKHLIINMI